MRYEPILRASVILPARLRPNLATAAMPRPTGRRLLVAGRRLATRSVLVLAFLLLALTGALLAFRVTYADKVFPGVHVADVDLGGLAQAEARAALTDRASALESGLVTFTYAGQTWKPTLTEMGASVDVEASLARALAVGREPEAVNRVRATAGLVRDDAALPLTMTLDYEVLDQWFDRVDRELGLPPQDAYLVVEGTVVSVEPDIDGTIVDRGAAAAQVKAALLGLTPFASPLPVVAQPVRVRAADLDVAKQQLEAALAKPVSVTFEGETWTIAPADLGRFVEQRVDPSKHGAEAVSLEVDEASLATWLSDQFAPLVNRDPVNAVVGWNEGPVALTESVDGIDLRPAAFAEAVAGSFFGEHALVTVPVDVTKPAVDSANLGALGITTKLAVGTSNYDGSTSDRATNVAVGANLLSNTLIPPGGEFSFNHAIGEITAEKGYVEAKVIQGERIDRDIGGGICQVSTTVFRAALLAGLPITEWWPHDYRLSFYEQDGWEPGFDASILQPDGAPFSGGDFKFLNPTDSWMLVESWADGVRVYVVIYGPELGYDVQISDVTYGKKIPPGPPLEVVDHRLDPGTIIHTELPEEGQAVHFTRDVYDRDGNLVESRQFWTEFLSRGNVWRVSPDMAGKSPASAGAA